MLGRVVESGVWISGQCLKQGIRNNGAFKAGINYKHHLIPHVVSSDLPIIGQLG